MEMTRDKINSKCWMVTWGKNQQKQYWKKCAAIKKNTVVYKVWMDKVRRNAINPINLLISLHPGDALLNGLVKRIGKHVWNCRNSRS